jgi:hypothetical protein
MPIRNVCLAAALCLSLTGFASAQNPTPPTTGAPQGQARPPYKPTNLQVLPQDTDLRKVMRQYSGDLGVECEFCHFTPPGARRPDFASDANPRKNVARYMIRMTDDINTKYLAMVPKHGDADDMPAKIDCGTCHRGHSHPEDFVPPPRQEGNRPPAATPPPATPPTR